MLNRRYEEGIAFYRKALELNPRLCKARAELGLNLMRLGQDEEARKQLEACYNAGETYPAVSNPLRLLDSYKNFKYIKSGNIILKLHQKEADLLQPYFEAELKRAIATYEKKYKMRLDRPVQLEVYPDHEDFAVRTLGMPRHGRAGRDVRQRGRHGQPLQPEAGRVPLGEHAVARAEPRLHAGRPPASACRAGSPKAWRSTRRRPSRRNGATV